ncbi:MAG: hypothetical protein PQJ60_06625 [Spirochaetales bacterium]|nr:hypothetical protein [Spirochaetales bacterium]
MSDSNLPEFCWFIPRGSATIFSAVKVCPTIVEGELRLEDKGSIKLASTKAKPSMGTIRFPQLEGESNKMRGPFIYMYNPKLHLISYWFALFKTGEAKRFAELLNSHSQVS